MRERFALARASRGARRAEPPPHDARPQPLAWVLISLKTFSRATRREGL